MDGPQGNKMHENDTEAFLCYIIIAVGRSENPGGVAGGQVVMW